MGEDKKPMPVDGSGSNRAMPDENGELASRRDGDTGGLPNVGESGGGAYPNPHTGKEGSSDAPDKFMGHGGQSDSSYYGNEDSDNAQSEE
jgi:hypothetical protein